MTLAALNPAYVNYDGQMPHTLHLHAEDPGDLERAAGILCRGGLVAFPTETVYGLGANALSVEAVAKIFAAKQRPSWDPLIVHLAGLAQLPQLTRIPDDLGARVESLAAAFWPGPLTMLLPKAVACPDEVTAGRRTVGIRLPAHPVAQALLRRAQLPIAAPSANRFGHVSPTTAQHVLDDLDGRIDAVLDGGPASVGVESTVVDPAETPMVVYRAGAVSLEALAVASGVEAKPFVPPAGAETASRASVPSPGVGLRHYAPETSLLLTGPTQAELVAALMPAVARGENVCVLLPEDWRLEAASGVDVVSWGRWDDTASLAAALFSALRTAEATKGTLILCPLPDPGGLRDALRDRLLKAARRR